VHNLLGTTQEKPFPWEHNFLLANTSNRNYNRSQFSEFETIDFIEKSRTMTIDRILRLVAGAFVLVSVILAKTVSLNWLYFTAFVGLNLLQSAFTNWCPLISILKKAGVPQTAPAGSKPTTATR
jgi:hypothetical protein